MIKEFLTHLQSEDLSPGTLATYRANLLLFGQWLIENGLTVPTLSQGNLKDYKAQLKERYKPATINIKLACVSLLLRWCLEGGLIAKNPMAKIKFLHSENIPKWLTQAQAKTILIASQKAIKQAQDKHLDYGIKIALRQYAIASTLLNTGLRVSELCDLKLADIQNGVITVRWGKGGKRREVPLNSQAQAAIEEWLKFRRSESDYVFVTTGRMTRQLVQFHLSELGRKLGFRLTPHLLRHTFGKRLVDRGVPLDRVAKLMGHSDINTTAIYTMPSLEDLRDAVKLLD